MNKIFLPPTNNQIAGPQTFLRNLTNYMRKNNLAFTNNIKEADGMLVSPTYPLEVVKKLKNENKKIIHRLDGVYYLSKHGEQYISLNHKIKEIYTNYADYIIFQSEYSKTQVFEMFSPRNSNYEIILNGVDKSIFYPANNTKMSKQETIRFVTTGNFRSIDMLEPIILALDLLSNEFTFTLKIVGPIINKELKKYFNRDYIQHIGDKNMSEVAEILQASDIFIYSHLNPPCPNSVIEAISCGLPVVGFDSGSMSELLFFSRDLLAYVSDDVFQKYENFDYKKLAEKIKLSINNFDKYKRIAREHWNLYSFEDCGKKYVHVFEKVLEKENKKLLSRLKDFLWKST